MACFGRRVVRNAGQAQRVRLAHLFDPMIAVHTSVVEPLPLQITAVILQSTGTDCSGEVLS